jgi:Cu(I)/Ag(I) efflux system membrane fusion protein
MMKKNMIYLTVAVIAGFLVGYVIFGTSPVEDASAVHEHGTAVKTETMWTCTMHPQIMQSQPGKCPICGMELIPADSGADGLAKDQFKMGQNAMALANIQTTVIGSSVQGRASLNLSGTIVANEKAVATQASYFNGRIEKLFVNFEGEQVRTGQQLASLYSPELVSAQQELITAASLKANQPALYQAVRNKLTQWKLSEKQIEQIEKSGRVQENYPVYANVSGTVSEIMVETGDYVKQGSPLFRIANLGSVWAVFDAYENQVSLLKEGQNIEIVTKAFPNKKFDAKISFIDPVLDPAKRTVSVRAVLENPNGLLKPGMFVAGSLVLGSQIKDETISVPETAVLWTGERSVVYIKTKANDPTFEMREIVLGDAINGGYVVISGLEIGEEIVTNGTFTVDAAAQLRGKKSMMNEEEGKTMTGHEGHDGMK